jgi:hypothetical protein
MNHVQIKLHPTMYKLYCCYIFPSEKYAGTKLFNYLLIFSKTKTQQSLYQNVMCNLKKTNKLYENMWN